jgi:hypothetical protein
LRRRSRRQHQIVVDQHAALPGADQQREVAGPPMRYPGWIRRAREQEVDGCAMLRQARGQRGDQRRLFARSDIACRHSSVARESVRQAEVGLGVRGGARIVDDPPGRDGCGVRDRREQTLQGLRAVTGQNENGERAVRQSRVRRRRRQAGRGGTRRGQQADAGELRQNVAHVVLFAAQRLEALREMRDMPLDAAEFATLP